jgi:hypothetical protein
VAFDQPAVLATAVADLVPVGRVTARRRNPLRGMLRSAIAGVDGVIELEVEIEGQPPLHVVVPRRADTQVDVVARAVNVAIEARSYLGPSADHVRRMSFDRSSKGLVGRTSAGEAGHLFDTFHLNADFLVPGAADARFAATSDRFEGTVVHEIWHVVEAAFEARSYRASVDFRRALGVVLGVETLEHAVRSWAPGSASPSSQAAVAELAAQVSDYATTNPKEATAEMFRLWWSTDEPSPVVARFGELLPEYLDARPGPPPRR